MLSITSIKNGIVIDHIKPGMGYRIYKLLELKNRENTVALITNAKSKKYGCKDLIKIENITDIDLKPLSILDKNITVNVIKNEKIIEKLQLELPESFTGIFTCKNPRCITTEERDMDQKFVLVDKDKPQYKCYYCDHYLKVK